MPAQDGRLVVDERLAPEPTNSGAATTASTEELIHHPGDIAHRLVIPLLRGLGAAERYPADSS